ncbi:MAG: RNA-binding S4 domain-containing protein [Bacteroidota bacterium]
MQKHTFQLTAEFIELIKLLKLLGIAEHGSEAKMMVDNQEILLNGQTETRYRAKLRDGDKVQVGKDLIIQIES